VASEMCIRDSSCHHPQHSLCLGLPPPLAGASEKLLDGDGDQLM